MIKANKVLEKYIRQNGSTDETNFKAATNIRELLAQIDLSAEVVPENNLDMFSRLITSLKKEDLSKGEKKIIKEIVKLDE
jgi:hypothetical protein